MRTEGETKKVRVSFVNFANVPKTIETCVLRDVLYIRSLFGNFLDTSVNEILCTPI